MSHNLYDLPIITNEGSPKQEITRTLNTRPYLAASEEFVETWTRWKATGIGTKLQFSITAVQQEAIIRYAMMFTERLNKAPWLSNYYCMFLVT